MVCSTAVIDALGNFYDLSMKEVSKCDNNLSKKCPEEFSTQFAIIPKRIFSNCAKVLPSVN